MKITTEIKSYIVRRINTSVNKYNDTLRAKHDNLRTKLREFLDSYEKKIEKDILNEFKQDLEENGFCSDNIFVSVNYNFDLRKFKPMEMVPYETINAIYDEVIINITVINKTNIKALTDIDAEVDAVLKKYNII